MEHLSCGLNGLRQVVISSAAMGRKRGQCAYCEKPSTTADHVPPKGLFAKPFPTDLRTVPSCGGCNVGSAKDDEYFRSVLALRHDAYGRSDAPGAAERTLRALTRVEGGGLRKLLLGGLVEVPIISEAGLFLGTTGAYDVDMPRLISVVERIARGLHYLHKNERVHPGSRVTVYPVEGIKDWTSPPFQMLRNAIAWAHSQPLHASARNVLNYRLRETKGKPSAIVWLLTFYETVPFVVVMTDPQSL
jgi:hypothetical protein